MVIAIVNVMVYWIIKYDDKFYRYKWRKMLWHTAVRKYCLEAVLFLPYKKNGKIRAETYDPYLFQYYLNQKAMIRLSLITVTFKTFSYEH